MINLLRANFARIFKNKLFWILCCAVSACALIIIATALSRENRTVDNSLRLFVLPVAAATSIFISLFLGTEYSDGTIRNKLTVGHSRLTIYFAQLLTSVLCAAIFSVLYILPVAAIGIPCLGLPDGETVARGAAGCLTVLTFCTLFVTVSMLYGNKAGATVVNLLIVFLLVIVAVFVYSSLIQPEFIHVYDGSVELMPNPDYPTGAKKIFLQIFSDLSPAGQAIQYIAGVKSPLWALPLYSASLTVFSVGAGIAVFERKNIK